MSDKTIVIRGELYWAKIVGDPVPYTGNPKFDKGPYWSVDVTPDEKSRKTIKDAGIDEKLKVGKGEKETRKESFLHLKVNAKRPDGKDNYPVKITDIMGRPWGSDKIGNGSIGDVKVKVKDYGTTIGAYIQEVRVLKHVPFEDKSTPMPELDEDDEYFAAAMGGAANDDTPSTSTEDDDDVPF